MGDPIDIGDIRVGDKLRVVNPNSNVTFTVREITEFGNGFRMVWNGMQAFGGRPGLEQYNTFFLVDRPSTRIESRGLAEVIAMGKDKDGELLRVQDPLRKYVPEFLGLKKTAKKGGRRRRKTRKSRR